MLKKISKFEYFEPSSINEAIQILLKYQDRAKVLAGGTDLLIAMKNKDLKLDCVINIKAFGENRYNQIYFDENQNIHIGALTKLAEIENSPLIKDKFFILSKAAGAVGSVQIRNLATLGGNICNASPAADTIPALLVMDASVHVEGREGKRRIPLNELFVGPGKTVLKNEIITEIEIPKNVKEYSFKYFNKGPRKAMDISQVVVATAIKFSPSSNEITDAKIGVGGVYATPKRCEKSEKYLINKKLTRNTITEVAEIICEEISPICDVRGSDWYKMTLAKNLLIEELESFSEGDQDGN